MKSIRNPHILAALTALALPAAAQAQSAAAQAQDSTPGDTTLNDRSVPFDQRADIVVTATGSVAPIARSGQSITLLTADEIASLQGPDVSRVLQRLPGVSLVRNGGLGSTTSLFVRGANSEQTLVTIDGVRVEDVAAPSGGYDFGGLSAGGIGRIELLRGSNSVIWGSDAIGGVLAVTSRTLNGVEASLEYGSHDTVDAQVNAGMIGNTYEFTLNGGYTHSDGISAAALGTEPDGFEQWRIGGHGKLALAPGLDLVATARYVHSRVDIDGYTTTDFINYFLGDTADYQVSKQASGRVGLAYASGALTLNSGIALSDTRRTYFNPTQTPNPNFATSGRGIRADLTGHLALPAGFGLDFGADSEWTRFRAETFGPFGGVDRGKDNLTSGHALLGWHSDRLDLAAGVRIDSHSRFGTHWTYGVNGAFRVVDDLRLRASYGEGFKAPTLYQLLSQYGNIALQPETSRSYDVGLEKGDRSSRVHASVTWFGRNVTNLIDFVDCSGAICASRPFGLYVNVGKTHAQGLEIEGDVRPTETLTLHAAYTWVESVNRTPGSANYGLDLARRPRHVLTLAGDWTTPLAGLALGVDGRLASQSFDDAGNFTRLPSWFVAGVRASLPVTKRFELYGRVENLGDVRYQTAAGYGQLGRTATVGVRAKL